MRDVLVYLFDTSVLRVVQRRQAPGTDLAPPETGPQNRGSCVPCFGQRPAAPLLNREKPADSGHFVGEQRTSVRTGVRGGPGRCANNQADQGLTARCGSDGPIEAQKEIS